MSLCDILIKCNFLRALETGIAVFCFVPALSSINNHLMLFHRWFCMRKFFFVLSRLK